ncbi:MAG TPA: T9SS type A sorting domain-containing protein [Chitinophagaceae bacterium]|jgi:hypothetical protein|nr:T9SS type A sorting domain-containing protein [Chitinophagaceae bacterium]
MKKFTLLFAFAIMASLIFGGTAFGQISFRAAASNTGTTTSITVTKPAGVVTNDVMIAVIAAQGTTADATAPAGWTKIDGSDLDGQTSRNGTVFYKVALAGEAANYTFTLGAGANHVAASISAFFNVNVSGLTPFDVAPGTIQVNDASTTVTAAAITTVSPGAAIIMCAMSAGKTGTHSAWAATSPASLAEVSDAGQGDGDNGASVGSAWALRAAAGATGNGTTTLSDEERNGGILLALKPVLAPSATLTPAGSLNISVGSSVNFTATANNYPVVAGNYLFSWVAAGATGLGTNPVSQAGVSNAKTLTYNTAGVYTVTVTITRGATVRVTNVTTINVFAAPLGPNMWASSSDGAAISTFKVNGGINFAGAPVTLFAPSFPGTTTGGTSTAAIGRSDKPSQATGFFYWLPNTSGNDGIVEVFGANATGGSPTRIGSIDVNGGGTTSLGFVRLGMGPDGTAWILAGDNSTLYLIKFKPNGVTANGSLPVADRLVIVDASVALSGGAVSTFQNGDICIAGDGNIVALANDGGGVTQIFVGSPAGAATTLTKKFDVLNQSSTGFTGSVNGVAFDLQGSLYVSSSDGLYYIDKNTVNGPAATISINQVWAGTGLQDLASNFFPTTIITPVKMGKFEVTKSGNNAVLSWTTLTETNSDHFEIERSFDGINFSVAGSVTAAGLSSDSRSYQFVDPITTSSKIIYYRLKTVEVDAREALSKIVALRLNGGIAETFSVYPNPFTSDLKVQINSEKEATVTVRISNALGQPVVSRKVVLQSGENIVVLTSELATLNKGMYVLEIISEDGKQTEKIIKR